MSSELHEFSTGAVRSTDADDVRYDLITPIGLRRLAETYAEGAKKYGDHNWRKGIPYSNLINHALNHLVKFQLGDTSEDHLAHAAWNILTLAHFQETRPDLDDLPKSDSAPSPGDTPQCDDLGFSAGQRVRLLCDAVTVDGYQWHRGTLCEVVRVSNSFSAGPRLFLREWVQSGVFGCRFLTIDPASVGPADGDENTL